ncbi:MAG: CBS domain-containing protein [Bacillota bacterium]
MVVGDFMTRRVVIVGMDATLEHILRVFQNTGFHHIPVVDLQTREFVGIISDRDLYKHLSPFLGTISESPRDTMTLTKKAYQIMTRRPVTVAPETPVKEAARLLLTKGISCLPVLSADGQLKGIVTWKDILRELLGLDVSLR